MQVWKSAVKEGKFGEILCTEESVGETMAETISKESLWNQTMIVIVGLLALTS